jgi:hypothetical protein
LLLSAALLSCTSCSVQVVIVIIVSLYGPAGRYYIFPAGPLIRTMTTTTTRPQSWP